MNGLMPDCPKCHQAIDSQTVTCPRCFTVLKAYGHPGIPLHRATGAASLCLTCTYHADDTCTYPQRPYARECTMYHDRTKPTPTTNPMTSSDPLRTLQSWLRKKFP